MTISRQKINFQTHLNLFNKWLEKDGRPLSDKEYRAIKNCKKHLKQKLEDNIANKAELIEQNLKRFLQTLFSNKEANQVIAQDFNSKATTLIKKIDLYIKCDADITPAAHNRLNHLKSFLSSNMAWLRNAYNIPILVRSGNAHRDSTEFDFENLRKNGNFDIRHQQRKHKAFKLEKINAQK